jgi:hypothetical protein
MPRLAHVRTLHRCRFRYRAHSQTANGLRKILSEISNVRGACLVETRWSENWLWSVPLIALTVA